MTLHPAEASAPVTERVRHELKRRALTVTEVERVTPQMIRITLTSADLADFISAAPDDHIKIFIPVEGGEVAMRDYTPRRFDAVARTLTLDFAVHEAGPATAWALAAKPGDQLNIGGPRGSLVVSPSIKTWLLIGDETALPAIGRRIEEASEDAVLRIFATVAGADEQQSFHSAAQFDVTWVHRPASDAADPQALLAALQGLEIAAGTYVWVAAEATVARAVRSYIVERLGYPLAWIKASGYWLKGKADAHETIE